MTDFEAGITHVIFATHVIEILLPALAIRRIGEHEIELMGRESIMRKGRILGPADNMFGILPFTLKQHISLADGEGLRVYLLAVQVGANLVALSICELLQRLLRHGKHAASAAGPVIKGNNPYRGKYDN